MQRRLALDVAPESGLSLRFFATVPLFAALAGAMLLWAGPSAWASRWTPEMLAAAHWMALGVLSMAMAGALFQILPVVGGLPLAQPQISAPAIHALLTAGALLLGLGLLESWPRVLPLAALLLVLAVAWLLAACPLRLLRPGAHPAAATLRCAGVALACLLPTAMLGAAMALALAFAWPLPLPRLTDAHLTLGLAGWIALLIVGVAFQVVPMFQATPPYPRRAVQALPLLLPLLVAARALAQFGTAGQQAFCHAALAAGFAGYALITFHVLARRKRPAPDPTTWFWRLAMASLLACCALATAMPLTLGVLFVVGFAYSAVCGMLYKIVPFLLWQRWQQQGRARPVAGIGLVIPEARALRQFGLHLTALLMLVAASLWPDSWSRPAALAMLVAALALLKNLVGALRL